MRQRRRLGCAFSVDRRGFFRAAGVALLGRPFAAVAQPAGKAHRLGILSPGTAGLGHEELLEELRELGYVERRNLTVERRYAEGRSERMPDFARDLVQRKVEVILAVSATAVEAARQATATIPIVMAPATEPVERGFVMSLARPGGNITGLSYAEGPEIAAKRLELLREAVPRATRIAALGDVGTSPRHLQATQKAAATLGVKLIAITVQARNYRRAFAVMAAERPGALVVLPSVPLNRDRKQILELAARHRLPAIYEWAGHVREGGLMGYGMNSRSLYRRVASFVDRLFKGANPAELPVEQPTSFELALNLKTAKALGLVFPHSVLVRADLVVQ